MKKTTDSDSAAPPCSTKLTQRQIEALAEQVRQVVIYGLLGFDDADDRSSCTDMDVADSVRDHTIKMLSEYRF